MDFNMDQSGLVPVNINQLSQKCQSKKELHTFLTLDGKAFLPSVNSTNVYFYKEIMRGGKEEPMDQYIKRDEVKVSSVPHIEGLTVENLLQHAKTKPDLLKYLPSEKDWVHIDRQWVCDVLYTKDTEGIDQMVKEALSNRKEKLDQSRNLVVEMRPEFMQALNSCLNFSQHRGKATSLLKASSKRKRTRAEMMESNVEEEEFKADKQGFFGNVKKARRENEALNKQIRQIANENVELSNIMQSQEQEQENINYMMSE